MYDSIQVMDRYFIPKYLKVFGGSLKLKNKYCKYIKVYADEADSIYI